MRDTIETIIDRLKDDAMEAVELFGEDELERFARDYAEGVTDEHGVHLGAREEQELADE